MRNKHRVKIFYSPDSSKLENEINDWLTEDSRPISIEDIKLSISVSTNGDGMFDTELYSALIWYYYPYLG